MTYKLLLLLQVEMYSYIQDVSLILVRIIFIMRWDETCVFNSPCFRRVFFFSFLSVAFSIHLGVSPGTRLHNG